MNAQLPSCSEYCCTIRLFRVFKQMTACDTLHISVILGMVMSMQMVPSLSRFLPNRSHGCKAIGISLTTNTGATMTFAKKINYYKYKQSEPDNTIGPSSRRSKEQGSSTAKGAPVSVSTHNFTPVSTPRPVQSDSQQSELMATSNSNKRKCAGAKKGEKATATIVQRHTTEKASVEIEHPTNEVANDSEHEPRRRRSRTARYQVDSDDQMECSGEYCQRRINNAGVKILFSESSFVSSRGFNVDGENVEEEKPKMAMKVTSEFHDLRTVPLYSSRTLATADGGTLPSAPLFDDTSGGHELEEDNEEGGMLAFGRALILMRDDRARSADE
ncbi:hypothetical protein BU17DRAFT_68536 [Hysterangium stoloniferum]|nr:hypothetical protein BU17DRAFT_68536 [Hysterangium stoloniferum]